MPGDRHDGGVGGTGGVGGCGAAVPVGAVTALPYVMRFPLAVRQIACEEHMLAYRQVLVSGAGGTGVTDGTGW